MSWLSRAFGRGDDLSLRAAALVERLNRQRDKWLDAVYGECRDGEALLGTERPSETSSLTSSAIASAFQAVHVLSLVHANKYVTAGDMTRFTSAVCAGLTNGAVTEEWKGVLRRYTDLKAKPLPEQLLSLSEEIAICVTGSPSGGMLIGPGLMPLVNEFLHRNLGIAADFFGDETTMRQMAESVRQLHEGATGSDNPVSVPEWLEEKASAAPTLWRVVMDATDLRLQQDYPQVCTSSDWGAFKGTATIGGCVALALQLHVEVPENYRTPLELGMRTALKQAIPGADAAYEDCWSTCSTLIPPTNAIASGHATGRSSSTW